MAERLAEFVNDSIPAEQPVDIIAHSMGGLITRAWMTGLANNALYEKDKIRKLILGGTPNFGTGLDELADLFLPALGCPETEEVVREAQIDQMLFGSQFLTSLNARWEKLVNENPVLENRAIEPENILLAVGCGSGFECNSDEIVLTPSATLPVPVVGNDYQIAYIDDSIHIGLLSVDNAEEDIYRY